MFKSVDELKVFDQIEDHPRVFPKQALKLLHDLELTTVSNFSNNMMELLFEVGKMDLSVGRLYEGHINALLLIETYGTPSQKLRYFKEAKEGKLFGVWNTENPNEGLIINGDSSSSNISLKGSKMFCSGALNIDRPIVTAGTKEGVQMLILNLDEKHSLEEDWSLWDPIGMRPSVSCRINFTAMEISQNQFLGNVNDYYKEPFFSWGAVRFCAVQMGGAQKIADIMLNHLLQTHRSDNPYQQVRIGKTAILMETAQLWMTRAGKIDASIDGIFNEDQKINFANMMRTLTLDLCQEIISIAEKGVGIQGVMKTHPLERPIRDLRVYLKQAGPDAALAHVGNYIAKTKS